MTHEQDVAVAQLETIARNCAANCDEQHSYLADAGKPEWRPHKWVVEAMATACMTRSNLEAEGLREQLRRAQEEIKSLRLALFR